MRWMRFLLLALISPWAAAATFVWSGAAGDRAYSNPSNWVGGAVPPNDGTSVLVFGNAGAGEVRLNTSLNVSQIQFTSSTNTSYSFTAGTDLNLTLQNGLVAAGGSNRFASAISVQVARPQAFDLTSGTVRIEGTVYGSAALTKAGAGSLQLLGSNVWNGGLNHTSGTIAVVQTGGLGAGTVRLAGGALAFTGPENTWVLNPVVIEAEVRVTGTRPIFAVFAGPVTLANSSRIRADNVAGVFGAGSEPLLRRNPG